MSAVVSSARIIDFAAARARRDTAAGGNGAAGGILLQPADDGRDSGLSPKLLSRWDGETRDALALVATALVIVAAGGERAPITASSIVATTSEAKP